MTGRPYGRGDRRLLETVANKFREWKKQTRALGLSEVSRVTAARPRADLYDRLGDDIARCVLLTDNYLTRSV